MILMEDSNPHLWVQKIIKLGQHSFEHRTDMRIAQLHQLGRRARGPAVLQVLPGVRQLFVVLVVCVTAGSVPSSSEGLIAVRGGGHSSSDAVQHSHTTVHDKRHLCLLGPPHSPSGSKVSVRTKVTAAFNLLEEHVPPGRLSVVRHYAERPGIAMTNYREGYPGKPNAVLYCEMCGWWSGAQCPVGSLEKRKELLAKWKAPELRTTIAKMNNDSMCGTAGHLLLRVGGVSRIVTQGGRWANYPPLNATVSWQPEDTETATPKRTNGVSAAADRCGAGHSWGIGFEDPRLFLWEDAPFIIMNGCAGPNRRLYLHNVRLNHTVELWVHDPTKAADPVAQSDLGKVQKNWTPYVHNKTLRLIYSFGKTAVKGVLEVVSTATGECVLVHGSLSYSDFEPYIGSTPLEPWSFPFYVGYVHTRDIYEANQTAAAAAAAAAAAPNGYCGETNAFSKKCTVYRSVPVVFNVETLETWYGEPLHLNPPNHPNAAPRPGETKDVQYPYDLVVSNDGSVTLGLEFQDSCPGWATITFQDFCRSLPSIRPTNHTP
jgi:hypothetical protein